MRLSTPFLSNYLRVKMCLSLYELGTPALCQISNLCSDLVGNGNVLQKVYCMDPFHHIS